MLNNSKNYLGITNINEYVMDTIQSTNQSYCKNGILKPIMEEYKKNNHKYDFLKSFQCNNQIRNGNNQENNDCINDTEKRQQYDKSTKKNDIEKKHNLINDEQMLIPEDQIIKEDLK